ncbi:MAG TPA: PIN domain-containing protein [Trueperaceae bacterium]
MKQTSGAYLLARAVVTLLGGTLGLSLADLLLRREILTGPNNILYLTLVGLLLGYLIGAPVAAYWSRFWQRLVANLSEIPPEAVLAAGTGAIVGLLVTVLVNNVLGQVPGFTWYWSLLIAVVLVFASSSFFVANRRLFGTLRMAPEVQSKPRTRSAEKIIDTSAIIDGRILEVLDANFLDSPIIIPRFVLLELQRIADSGDPLRRRKGRRGLEMLDRLAQQERVPTEVISDEPAQIEAVDEKLVALCLERGADLITTDYNLDRVAALQGIRVLNVNQLANAVKATFLPGERLSLSIVREGREPGQGLAYLEDGTMVVIEEAAELVGRTVDAVVTSSLQTNMGRMIFARLGDEARE